MTRFIAQKNGDNLFITLSPVCPQFTKKSARITNNPASLGGGKFNPKFNFLHGRRLFVALDMQGQL